MPFGGGHIGFDYVQNPVDTISLIDLINRDVTFSKTEVATLSDTLTHEGSSFYRILDLEIATLTDTISKKATGKVLTLEQARLGDSITLIGTFFRTLLDTTSLSDLILRGTTTSKLETVSLSDTIISIAGKNLPETLSLGDLIFRDSATTKTELATLTDSLLRGAGKLHSETLTLSDLVIFQIIFNREMLETATLSDILEKIHGQSWTMQDALDLIDSVTTAATFYRQMSQEIVQPIDVLNRGLLRELPAEISSLIDSISKEGGKFPSETLTIEDSITKVGTFGRSLTDIEELIGSVIKGHGSTKSETVTLSDMLERLPNKIFSETGTLTDAAIIRNVSAIKTETGTLSDTLTKAGAFYRSQLETETLGDTLLKQPGKLGSETCTLSDSLLRGLIKSETATLSDTLTRSFARTFSEELSTSDLLVKQGSFAKLLSEGITLIDSVQPIYYLLTLSETISLRDDTDAGGIGITIFTPKIRMVESKEKLRSVTNTPKLRGIEGMSDIRSVSDKPVIRGVTNSPVMREAS